MVFGLAEEAGEQLNSKVSVFYRIKATICDSKSSTEVRHLRQIEKFKAVYLCPYCSRGPGRTGHRNGS